MDAVQCILWRAGELIGNFRLYSSRSPVRGAGATLIATERGEGKELHAPRRSWEIV